MIYCHVFQTYSLMSLRETQVKTLNHIIAAIDEKAAEYKEARFDMPQAQADSQKKLLLDLIKNALDLANEMNPKPLEVIDDLNRLAKQFHGMN